MKWSETIAIGMQKKLSTPLKCIEEVFDVQKIPDFPENCSKLPRMVHLSSLHFSSINYCEDGSFVVSHDEGTFFCSKADSGEIFQGSKLSGIFIFIFQISKMLRRLFATKILLS